MSRTATQIAYRDIYLAVRQIRLAAFLAYEDIRQRYVRTMLGPLWIVLSTGVWFAVMGFVMSNLFHQPMKEYLPFIISGLLSWVLISTCIQESSQVLVSSAPLIYVFRYSYFYPLYSFLSYAIHSYSCTMC